MKAIYIFIIILIVIIIAIFIAFGDTISRPKDGYGTWKTEESVCTNNTNLCAQPGTKTVKKVCIPNQITGRGCLNDNETQTYQTYITTEECNLQCRKSIWKESYTDCINESRTHKLECVLNDPSGINECILTQTAPIRTVTYNVGDIVNNIVPCVSETTILQKWKYVPSKTFVDFEQREDISIEEPSLRMFFGMLPDCQTSLGNKFGVLQEGYIVSPMTCNNITPIDLDPPVSGCNVLTTIPVNGQACNNILISPTSISSKLLSNDFNNIMCAGLYGGNNPKIIIPCRYVPTNENDYGNSSLNTLINSVILLDINQKTIIPIQTPNRQNHISMYTDNMYGPSDLLNDVPLTYIDGYTRTGCSPQALAFNTGALFIFGIRAIISPTKFRAVIGLEITASNYGWLKTTIFKGKNIATWTQGAAGYDMPGIFAKDAQLFDITYSPLNPGKLSGYPEQVKGHMQLQIRTTGGDIIYIASTDTIVGSDTVFLNIDSVRAILIGQETEICTRSLYGPSNCNILHSISTTDTSLSAACTPPQITP